MSLSDPLPQQLQSVWSDTDALFKRIEAANLLQKRPIAHRNPFIFYALHLPSFSADLFNRAIPDSIPSHPSRCRYSRGIDPPAYLLAPTTSVLSTPALTNPALTTSTMHLYISHTRTQILAAISQRLHLPIVQHAVRLIIDHERMHHETLHYMLSATSLALHIRIHNLPTPSSPVLHLAATDVVLGAPPASPALALLDNEHDTRVHHVAAFTLSAHPVSNAEFLRFILADGYAQPALWGPHWLWVKRNAISMPSSWRRSGVGYEAAYLSPDDVADHHPPTDVSLRPALVSVAEASAYARWRGARLPSEGEWHAATVGVSGQSPLPHPGWHDVSQGSQSHIGAVGLVGNGWEICNTVFDRFPKFRPSHLYPGYSLDFFDGNHFILKGASPFTHPSLVRPSFRNFFQPCYRHALAKFRLAWDD